MASKYAGLKGKVPSLPRELSPKEMEIEKFIHERAETSLADITAEYNALVEAGDKLALQAADNKLKQDAAERLILQRMDGEQAEGVKMNGYTWSEKSLPFAVTKGADISEIKQYFRDNGMEDQLELKISELATRLNAIVKEEAENNELEVGTRIETDHEGVEHEVPEVKSKVPGVRVYLKSSLSRVKSTKGAK